MSRYLSGLANAVLLGLSCFFLARTATAVFATFSSPVEEEIAPVEAAPPPTRSRWEDRQVILDRDLFGAAVAPVEEEPEPEESMEELEATKLPLELIGTVASTNPELSWAAVLERDARATRVLREGSKIEGKSGAGATVERIERKRIVLREGGELRELALSEDAKPAPTETRQAARRAPRQTAAQRRASRRPQPARRAPATQAAAAEPEEEEEEPDVRSVAELFSKADILPRYEDGEMVGFQVDSIEPGSVFDEIGLDDGDLITELNGIRITSPEQSARVLSQLSESTSFSVTVEGPDGPETLQVTLPEE